MTLLICIMKVSIIMACFNQEAYLSEALDSVIKQTFLDWECIIIDDGSTDKSAKIAMKYAQMDSRIKYLYQDNQGVCKARNNAINTSEGEYILCLDADDLISNEYIYLCVKELDKNPNITLVTCNYQCFGRINKIVKLEPYSIEKLMGHNLFINCSMFRKKDFIKVNGFNENMKLGLEDWDFWLSILKDGGDVKYLEGIHFFYRIKSKKESRNVSEAMVHHEMLRKQMWLNHQDLYAKVYSSPLYSNEYLNILYSKEYVIGKILLKPLRHLYDIFYN